MTPRGEHVGSHAWEGASAADAADAALALLATAPAALGGSLVVGGSLECERWLQGLRAARRDAPWRRVPTGVGEDRLLGGLDVAATLASGTRTLARGLLAEAHGGTLALPRAADAAPGTVAVLARAIDDGALRLERDGLSAVHDSEVCVAVAAGAEEREQLSATLLERLALHVSLPDGYAPTPPTIAGAAFDAVVPERAHVTALAAVAEALGVASPRALLLAVRAARAAAASTGRTAIGDDDLACAVALVLAPRATRVPAPPAPPEQASASDSPSSDAPPDTGDTSPDADAERGGVMPAELLIEAARASLPPALLADVAGRASRGVARGSAGRKGVEQRDDARGRRVGTRQGRPRRGARLDLVETLRAAAPWQPVRAASGRVRDGLDVRGDDLRVQRRVRRTGTTTLFLVDASGSAALGRLAEAKGAVELLLAESYVRRDRVGLVAFKGTSAELLLPPTRALSRARRALAGLTAGGGTPLASALLRAGAVVRQVAREGGRSAIVLLTDGRANVARDGAPGRARAREDAHAAARALRGAGVPTVLVDTSPRGDPEARALAVALDARYVALPIVTATALHERVRALLADAPAGARA